MNGLQNEQTTILVKLQSTDGTESSSLKSTFWLNKKVYNAKSECVEQSVLL